MRASHLVISNIGQGAPHTFPAFPYAEGFVSWHASAYVKPLTHHADGTKLSAREKLILFVLAESHNEDRGNCAWIGVEKAARNSLTSRSRFIELLKRLEQHGTISIERREGKSSLYRFPELPVRESDPSEKRNRTPPVRQLQDPTRPTAIGPKPLESIGTDIPPLDAASSPEYREKLKDIKDRIDAWQHRRWQTDDSGKRFLISPSSGEKVYEEALV